MKDKQVDEMLKNIFSEEEVPETLNFKLKYRLREGNIMRKNNKFLFTAKCAGIAVICFICSVTALANSDSDICDAMQDIPLIGAITKVVTFRTYNDKTDNFTAYVEIPEIDNFGEVGKELNKKIQSYLGDIIDEYENEKEVDKGEGRLLLTSGYDIITDDENYFSIKIWTNEVRNGTNQYNNYYTIDKKHNKIVGLNDLFISNFDYKNIIYKEIRSQMKKIEEKSDTLTYFDENMGLSCITGN